MDHTVCVSHRLILITVDDPAVDFIVRPILFYYIIFCHFSGSLTPALSSLFYFIIIIMFVFIHCNLRRWPHSYSRLASALCPFYHYVLATMVGPRSNLSAQFLSKNVSTTVMPHVHHCTTLSSFRIFTKIINQHDSDTKLSNTILFWSVGCHNHYYN